MNVYVINAPGEHYNPDVPSGYDSWISYWCKKRYPNKNVYASRCRNCGTETRDLDGGHVELCEKHKDGKWYYTDSQKIFITPLCPTCNNPDNSEPFIVDNLDLISVN